LTAVAVGGCSRESVVRVGRIGFGVVLWRQVESGREMLVE
jgi:hypothetical protein